MPTPAKKGRKSTSNAPDDQDPMSPMREKFAKDLRPHGRLPNLENVISSIQKLLESNKLVSTHCLQAIDPFENKLSTRKVLLTKREFEYVRTHHVDGKLLFTTTPEYSEKEFDITPLIKLPPELAILHPKRSKSGLIDFESLFEMSSVLHGDILISFLANLKKQLILVQTCLNDIENWWNEVPTNLSFMESIFGAGVVKEAQELKAKDPLCENCRCHFSCHEQFFNPHSGAFGASTTSYSYLCRINRFSSQPVQSWPDFNNLFNSQPVQSSFGSNVRTNQLSMTQFPSSSQRREKFKHSAYLPLKSFVTSTKIDDRFNIFDENERARLLKLVRFVSHK